MLTIKDIVRKHREEREALKKYPFLQLENAYKMWKKDRGEEPILFNSVEESYTIKRDLSKLPPIFCKCGGKVIVEGICPTCSEFRVGYRSKVKCLKCKHSELSKKEVLECLTDLYSF